MAAETRLARFLSGTRWETWARAPMAGDASHRRYWRATGPAGETVILVEDTPGSTLERFIRIAGHLRGCGLSAPEILRADAGQGLAVLSDLGPDHFAAWIDRRNADPATLYRAAVDVLAELGRHPAPPDLTTLAPDGVAQMLEPFFAHYATGMPTDLREPIVSEIAAQMGAHCGGDPVLSLRDYHAENLIWRPERAGLDRVGLLDFQDAIRAHPTYDLASLLRDARRDPGAELAEAMIDHFATATGAPRPETAAAFAVMAVLRNLRILGIFAALGQSGRSSYLGYMPTTLTHLKTDLRHPALKPLSMLLGDGGLDPESVSDKANFA